MAVFGRSFYNKNECALREETDTGLCPCLFD